MQGYGRLGAAFHGLGMFEEAAEAYETGLKIEPENAQLKKGLADLDRAMMSTPPGQAWGSAAPGAPTLTPSPSSWAGGVAGRQTRRTATPRR